LIVLVAGAGSASACEEPGGGGTRASGQRAERVAFTIPTTLRGAHYTLTIDGNEVASGSDRDEPAGVSGEFTVPDLGGQDGKFDVVAHVVHKADDSAWGWTAVQLHYRAKSASEPPPPPPPPSPEPQPQPQPQPSGPSLASEPPTVIGGAILGAQQLLTQKPKRGKPSRSAKGRAERAAERAATTLRKAKAKAKAKKRKKAKRKKRRKARRNRHEPVFQSGARRLQPSTAGQGAGDSFPEDEFAGLGYRVAWPFLLGAAGAGLLAILGIGGLARRRRSTRAA
jgi:hypothetical protein